MKAKVMGKGTIKLISAAVNIAVLTMMVLASAFAGYALWDSKQLYQAADKSKYTVYKPSLADEGKSFKELQALNPEVFAWLCVYGTNIDYPVTQCEDNMKYVNTNAEGLYSLSGTIFLDCDNSGDFSDFNSILYGHHMDKQVMFGQIGEFADEDVFDSHQYGSLYYEAQEHGIVFFAFVHTDAYDGAFFTANVEPELRQEYLDDLLGKAIYTRDIGITIEDHIVLLSTCSSTSTNGRDILVGRIDSETYEDPFINTENNDIIEPTGVDSRGGYSWWLTPWALIGVLIAIAIALVLVIHYRSKHKEGKSK